MLNTVLAIVLVCLGIGGKPPPPPVSQVPPAEPLRHVVGNVLSYDYFCVYYVNTMIIIILIKVRLF
jgi:hypothetical protein